MTLERSFGKVIDWRRVTRNDYMMSMEPSPINDLELRVLLRSALSNATEDHDIIFHGIEQSYYYYEGYDPKTP